MYFVVFKGQLLVPLVEPCCPVQSVCHITVSRLMSERILNINSYIDLSASQIDVEPGDLTTCRIIPP